jgi:hypothetical protein
MAAGHILTLSDEHSYKGLNSILQQSERPMLSIVHSSINAMPNDIDEIHRGVSRSTPSINPVLPGNDASRPSELLHSYRDPDSGGTRAGSFIETSKAPTGTTMFEKTSGYRGHKNIHEALQSHTTEETTHTGTVSGRSEGNSFIREMTPEDRFDHQSALAGEVHPLKPHSGLIYVSHYHPVHGWTDHSYNPETEQLLKTDIQRAG